MNFTLLAITLVAAVVGGVFGAQKFNFAGTWGFGLYLICLTTNFFGPWAQPLGYKVIASVIDFVVWLLAVMITRRQMYIRDHSHNGGH